MGADQSNACIVLPIKTWEWMMQKVEKFKKEKKRNPRYVTINEMGDYIEWQRYEEMTQRYKKYINENGKKPPSIIINPECKKPTIIEPRNGVWVWASTLNTFDIGQYEKRDITQIFINEAAFTKEEYKKQIEKTINEINKKDAKIHAWIQCLKGEKGWINPANTEKAINNILKKIKKAMEYNITGVHLDYIRYPGTAYLYKNATENINNIISAIRNALPSKMILTAAVMPEMEVNAYLYGQDYKSMGKYLDAIIPMAYKGNFQQKSEWIGKVTKYILQKSGRQVWTGLSAYRSDNDPTPIPASELQKDIRIAINSGANGVVLFRHGIIDKGFFK